MTVRPFSFCKTNKSNHHSRSFAYRPLNRRRRLSWGFSCIFFCILYRCSTANGVRSKLRSRWASDTFGTISDLPVEFELSLYYSLLVPLKLFLHNRSGIRITLCSTLKFRHLPPFQMLRNIFVKFTNMLDFSFSIVDETTTALMFTRNETRFFSLAVSTKTSPTPSVVRSKYYFWFDISGIPLAAKTIRNRLTLHLDILFKLCKKRVHLIIVLANP